MTIAQLFYFRRLRKQLKGKIVEFSELDKGEEFIFVEDALPPSSPVRRLKWQPVEPIPIYTKVGPQRCTVSAKGSRWIVLWLEVIRRSDYEAAINHSFGERCVAPEPCRCRTEEAGECGVHRQDSQSP